MKRLRASPPPKPTPKRTSETPAPYSRATSNPSSPGAAQAGWKSGWGGHANVCLSAMSGQPRSSIVRKMQAYRFFGHKMSVEDVLIGIGFDTLEEHSTKSAEITASYG